MRWLLLVLLAVLVSPVRAGLADSGMDKALCQAADTESALPETINKLMDENRFRFREAGDLLSMDCNGRSLLQEMVEDQQAENLEYAVIDLGVDLNQPLIQANGGKISLVQWLENEAASADKAQVRSFAALYLKRFRDKQFNPNLQVSLK